MILRLSIVLILTFSLHILSVVHAQHVPLCDVLNDIESHLNETEYSESKSRRVRAICDAIRPPQTKVPESDLNSIPDFDLAQIQSGKT